MTEPFDGNNVAKAVCSVEKFENIKMKFRLVSAIWKMSTLLVIYSFDHLTFQNVSII